MKGKIVKILMDELSYVYCFNCRLNDLEEDHEDWNCDFCHRKNMNWEISEGFANQIASKILDIKGGSHD